MPDVELRSDTFTQPTPAMLSAMTRAPLGDDVYGEDPTVRLLEEQAAEILGKEAGCLMPSGTMANLASLTAHAPRGSRIFVARDSDIYTYEAHGVSVCSGVALDPVDTDVRGLLDQAQMERLLPEDSDDPQFSVPAAVCMENTANRAGGIPLTSHEVADTAFFAERNGLSFHIDGARIFNAAVALGISPAELTRPADSVQFCLSKGLSAPIGSMVVGRAEFITRVRRIRKMLGGGMRQAGVIAAAGIVALDTMIDRLAEDHAHASMLAEGLAGIDGISVVPVVCRTNIVMFQTTDPALSHERFIGLLAARGIRLAELGRGQIRAVTHRHVTSRDITTTLAATEDVMREHRATRGLATTVQGGLS
jgi:threonine aldolase